MTKKQMIMDILKGLPYIDTKKACDILLKRNKEEIQKVYDTYYKGHKHSCALKLKCAKELLGLDYFK